MANQEQLEILRQGVDAWNKWRASNTMVQIDLGGADLHESDFNGVNLSGANLLYANLSSTNLIRANLKWAILIETNLNLSNLENITIGYTRFGNTALTETFGVERVIHFSFR